MSRRRQAIQRHIEADPLFESVRVAQLVNYVMEDGKKSTARDIVHHALNQATQTLEGRDNSNVWNSEDFNDKALKYLEKILDTVGPTVEVRPKRVGGATYQVPIEVNFHRRVYLSIRWLVTQARQRSDKGMKTKLARELVDAYYEQGGAVEMRKNAHRMAKANEAFAHYQW
jgi:small subunit ribosomal protein S7